MKIIQLNYSDISGGAARAAYRIHHCLRAAGIDSHLWVEHALAGDWTVERPTSKRAKLATALRSRLGGQLRHLLKTSNSIIHSPAILPSHWPARIDASDADVVHLHWIAGEMLSIADIGRIRKPLVWTLHDMWAFCGAEHYTDDERWRNGYQRDNRPPHESGFDLNRWTWARKRKHWRRPIHIVTPSRWLADCARASPLMREWPVSVVPNPLDTDRWRPLEQRLARELLQLPTDVPLVLFGAMGGGRDPRKGFDLLMQALTVLRGESVAKGLELVVFGQRAPRYAPDLGFPIHYSGHLHDDLSLRALYSAADVLVVPSRQDNLPNTGVEAQACGTPVVAFDIGGLPDIIEHQVTGYLARAFDIHELVAGIEWVLGNSEQANLRGRSRRRAIERFSCPLVSRQYHGIYEMAVHHETLLVGDCNRQNPDAM